MPREHSPAHVIHARKIQLRIRFVLLPYAASSPPQAAEEVRLRDRSGRLWGQAGPFGQANEAESFGGPGKSLVPVLPLFVRDEQRAWMQ